MTLAPAAARPSATARPIPLPAPVTAATLPSSMPIVFLRGLVLAFVTSDHTPREARDVDGLHLAVVSLTIASDDTYRHEGRIRWTRRRRACWAWARSTRAWRRSSSPRVSRPGWRRS